MQVPRPLWYRPLIAFVCSGRRGRGGVAGVWLGRRGRVRFEGGPSQAVEGPPREMGRLRTVGPQGRQGTTETAGKAGQKGTTRSHTSQLTRPTSAGNTQSPEVPVVADAVGSRHRSSVDGGLQDTHHQGTGTAVPLALTGRRRSLPRRASSTGTSSARTSDTSSFKKRAARGRKPCTRSARPTRCTTRRWATVRACPSLPPSCCSR